MLGSVLASREVIQEAYSSDFPAPLILSLMKLSTASLSLEALSDRSLMTYLHPSTLL